MIICLLVGIGSCNTSVNKSAGICISFDDRFIREWHSLLPLFEKYNARVTFFITQFDSLSAEEISMLHEIKNKGHEIGSHGAIHVISENYIQEHSYQEYMDHEIEASIRSMSKAGFSPESFAYPYGASYWFTDYLLLKKFSVVRKVSAPRKTLTDLDEIYFDFSGRGKVSALSFDQGSGLTREMVIDGLKRASENREAILLYGHSPAVNNNPDRYFFDTTLLEFILAESQKQNLRFYTASELVNDL